MKKKQIIIAIVLVVVILGGFLARKFILDSQITPNPAIDGGGGVAEPEACPQYEQEWGVTEPDLVPIFGDTGPPDADSNPSVSLGDYSQHVLYAQMRINSQYGGAIKEDGKFGCETFGAVVELTGYDAINGFELNDLR